MNEDGKDLNAGQEGPVTKRTCLICGCTDSKACEGGCDWLRLSIVGKSVPICSKCITDEVPDLINLLVDVVLETHQPEEIDKDHHGDKHACSTCDLIKLAQKTEAALRQ